MGTEIIVPSMVLRKPVFDFRFDQSTCGWTLEENIAIEGEPNLVLDTFLRKNESCVGGKAMLRRGKAGVEKKGALAGQLHAERMYMHPEDIPVEWQQFTLVFGGTVWRDNEGDLCVICLRWDHTQWQIDTRWLKLGFDFHDRLVRIGK